MYASIPDDYPKYAVAREATNRSILPGTYRVGMRRVQKAMQWFERYHDRWWLLHTPATAGVQQMP